MMKSIKEKWHVVFAAVLMFFGTQLCFAEKSIGFDLGEKMHWNENGGLYNAQAFTLSFDCSGEQFGIKPFFSFSFSTTNASNISNNAVTYNYTDSTFVETIGVKPFYIFRKTDFSNSYIGFLFAISFNQIERSATEKGTSYKRNYTTGELGIFVGNKWHASNKLDVFAECDISSKLFQDTTKYEIAGKELEFFQGSMSGGGGTNSWSLYVTPRLGIAYNW